MLNLKSKAGKAGKKKTLNPRPSNQWGAACLAKLAHQRKREQTTGGEEKLDRVEHLKNTERPEDTVLGVGEGKKEEQGEMSTVRSSHTNQYAGVRNPSEASADMRR